MTSESALDRHLRIIASATGAGTVIFTALAFSSIVVQASSLHPAFYFPATILFCALPVVMIPLSLWGSSSAIRVLARAHAGVSVVLLVGWAPSMISSGLPAGGAPWVLNTLAVATAMAVLGWPVKVAWVLTFMYAVMGVILRYAVLDDGWSIPIQDGASLVSFCSIIAAMLMLALDLGRRQDRELVLAEGEARRAAMAESRSRARSRFGALVHDDVITTLLAAARAETRSEAVERSAVAAIARIDRFSVDDDRNDIVSAQGLEMEIRAAATEVIDGVRVSGTLAAFEGEIPSEAAMAFIGAIGEATRNSARHAGGKGRVVARTLVLAASPESISVELRDDGRGFDPQTVAPERLGIQSSIRERVEAVDNAAVQILSSPGAGTSVRLTWTAVRVGVAR